MITFTTKDKMVFKFWKEWDQPYDETYSNSYTYMVLTIPGVMDKEKFSTNSMKVARILRKATILSIREIMDGLNGKKDITVEEVQTISMGV